MSVAEMSDSDLGALFVQLMHKLLYAQTIEDARSVDQELVPVIEEIDRRRAR